MSGIAPYIYQWSNGAITATITNLRAGNYQVTVTDNNGCSEVAAVVITRQPDLLIELDAAASCENEGTGMANVVPRSGQAPYAFRWSDGQTTGTAVNLTPGSYTVTVIDALGCMAVDSVEVPAIEIDVEVQIDAQNNTATVTPSGGRPAYTYLWSNGQTTPTATNLEPGQTYTVTITDQNGTGCEEIVSITIPTNSLMLNVQATPSCEKPAAGTAQVTITGGVAPYSILWSDGQTGEIATGLAPGTYMVTVTDAAGNTKADTVIVEAFAFDFTLSSTQQGCSATPDGSATVTILEGIAPYTYQWNSGATMATINNLAASIYKVTVTDSRGCTASKEITVNKTILTLAVELTNAGCTGEATGTATIIPSGGTAPYSYEWTTGATTATIEIWHLVLTK
ncbi:MAG: hypothetical protein HC892_17630 [Saprospiraceae bacterium]|nr:hypothetical protein [Saprospiraceae bacterium]